jgi:hypothetical protein
MGFEPMIRVLQDPTVAIQTLLAFGRIPHRGLLILSTPADPDP